MSTEARFEIHAEIHRASTPPTWVYTDAAVHAAQRERVFAPSWQLVADADSVRVPGQVWPFTLLEGCLDEPLLLVRDMDDALRCISNVCTHRGMLVCESPGVERSLRCRYHGRRFGLDGRFQHMPEFAGVEGFPSAADDLQSVGVAALGPLVFASVAPRRGFAEWLAPFLARHGELPMHDLRLDATRSRDYLVACNWALYVENYLEGFHIPYVHASLTQAVDYDSYRTELFDECSVQIAQARGGESAFDAQAGAERIAAYYWWLFPNLMLNVYPWGISVNVVRPLGVERTRVSFLTYVLRPDLLDAGAGGGLDRVEREDEAIVEAVQRGLRSRIYSRGRYSPTRETGTHHFHRLLAAALFE